MTQAIDVLKYINETAHPTGEVQYQKFLYYVQAWSLTWDGVPMFDDDIEAWAMGPVVPAVRHCRHMRGESGLTDDQKATVDAVVSHYKQWTGGSLSHRTHAEGPWREARAGLPDRAPSNAKVSHDAMRREYSLQSLKGEGPHRPPARTREADTDTVLALAKAASKRWSHTLALLAE